MNKFGYIGNAWGLILKHPVIYVLLIGLGITPVLIVSDPLPYTYMILIFSGLPALSMGFASAIGHNEITQSRLPAVTLAAKGIFLAAMIVILDLAFAHAELALSSLADSHEQYLVGIWLGIQALKTMLVIIFVACASGNHLGKLPKCMTKSITGAWMVVIVAVLILNIIPSLTIVFSRFLPPVNAIVDAYFIANKAIVLFLKIIFILALQCHAWGTETKPSP